MITPKHLQPALLREIADLLASKEGFALPVKTAEAGAELLRKMADDLDRLDVCAAGATRYGY